MVLYIHCHILFHSNNRTGLVSSVLFALLDCGGGEPCNSSTSQKHTASHNFLQVTFDAKEVHLSILTKCVHNQFL